MRWHDFRFWHQTDMPILLSDVRFWGDSVAKVVLQKMSNF